MLKFVSRHGARSAVVLSLVVASIGAAWAQKEVSAMGAPAQETETEAVVAVPAKTAMPSVESKVVAKGLASWYGGKFHGRRTASGELYDKSALTAAHKTLPFGSMVRVRSERTGKEVVVRINDRGPYAPKRVIDLSSAAASALGIKGRGLATVNLFLE